MADFEAKTFKCMTNNASQGQEVCDKVGSCGPPLIQDCFPVYDFLKILTSKECFCFLRLLVLRYLQSF